MAFSDKIEAADIWRAKSALAGRPVGEKLQGGDLSTWAAACRGINSNGAWINHIVRYWDRAKPEDDAYRCLFPYFAPSGEVDVARSGTIGVVQNAPPRAELELGFPKLLT